MKSGVDGPNAAASHRCMKVQILETLDKGEKMTLNSGAYLFLSLCTHLIYHLYQLQSMDFNSFYKIYCSTIFPYKSNGERTRTCREVQGHPRMII